MFCCEQDCNIASCSDQIAIALTSCLSTVTTVFNVYCKIKDKFKHFKLILNVFSPIRQLERKLVYNYMSNLYQIPSKNEITFTIFYKSCIYTFLYIFYALFLFESLLLSLFTNKKPYSRFHLNCGFYFGKRTQRTPSMSSTRAKYKLCILKYFAKFELISPKFFYIIDRDTLLELLIKK